MSRANIFNTGTTSYLELIGNGKTYRVPPYQRDYAWTQQEWEDLWNDVVALRGEPDGRHYMGALVVQTHGDREFLVIDGQQRLATISLLALAVIGKLRRMADGGEEEDRNRERATELRNRFIGEKDPASLVESSRLCLNEVDDPFYQDYLVQLRPPLNPRGLPRSNALLWNCYRYFAKQIDELDASSEGEAIAKIGSRATSHDGRLAPRGSAGGSPATCSPDWRRTPASARSIQIPTPAPWSTCCRRTRPASGRTSFSRIAGRRRSTALGT